MNFNNGDKVRFLNEKGEGVVVEVLSRERVRVRTKEGFEMEYKDSELVHADVSKLNKSVQTTTTVEGKKIAARSEVNEGEEEGADLQDGIYLLFTPQDEQKLVECDIDIVLVNNTDYDILYSFSYRYEKEFVVMSTGQAEEGSLTNLDTILRKRMEEYATMKLDVIFYKSMPYEPLEPHSEIIKLKTVKFYKPNTYSINPFNGKLSMLEEVCLFEEEAEIKEPGSELRKRVAEFMLRKKPSEEPSKEGGKNISRSHEYYAKQQEKEVDLHLEELLDNSSGMSNGEKLNYQLNYFKRELESAIAGNTRKIIFIHGIGNGRLKAEICAILDNYKNLYYHDASFRKFGYGATEVVIRG